VGEVQNNQVTLTYTAYNEAADPETGVVLMTTLAPGVTVAGSATPPSQEGQDLAWSLGTIDGFSRASVSVTVNLPTTTPSQLDSGARVFATLDAASVSNSTVPATLRAGTVDPALLASTADANTTDPYIQETAAILGYDPNAIYNFLHTQVGYNAYLGSVRGARGTLWTGSGNALDVASLGVALMRASGIPAQYVSGTLSPSQSQSLILTMFPSASQTNGYIPNGTVTADPANDSALLSETENHSWFQFDSGSGMQDADPLIPGASIGQSFTTSTGSFAEVPDALREKTEVQIVAEITSQGLFGPSSAQKIVLDQTFNDVDLVGHPLSFGNFVSGNSAGFIITATTYTYTPFMVIGDDANPDPTKDETISGTLYQEMFMILQFASSEVTGLFMNVTLSGPEGASQT
jgi:transglutaminase-like putative cysteine protease